jgi:S1-C subfamily serine protease
MLTDSARPRVSRETRRLLAAAGLALLALWVLARLRFPERPIPNPVAPVLTQISPPATFADLSGEIEEVRRRITSALAAVTWPPATGPDGHTRTFPAWPLRDDLAITMVPSAFADTASDVVSLDPPTGLALVRTINPAAGTRLVWTPDRLELARYLFSVAPAPSPAHPSVIPVYVSSLEPLRSPAWSSEIWRVPAATGLSVGGFIFTAAGEWLGIAAEEDGQPVIIPAAAILDRVAQMGTTRTAYARDLGIDVQGLTAPLVMATGATTGVIVTFVDSAGAAAKALVVADVIEHLNGEPVPTPFAWQVHATRLAAGAPVTLRVRRRGTALDVAFVAPAAAPARPGSLGVTLARQAGAGSRVLQVESDGAARRAGLKVGDLVTLAGEQSAPSPAQIRRAFETAPDGGVVLFGVMRDGSHRLVTLTR